LDVESILAAPNNKMIMVSEGSIKKGKDPLLFLTKENGEFIKDFQLPTKFLAAANPKFGRFDPYEVLGKQINLPPALISRFDLIFPVRDLPNRDVDEKIASHVLNIQQNVDIKEPEIPIPLLKKYVAYAKQNIKPKLTDGAIDEIKSFYVELRNMGTDEEGIKPIPISARQLEALVRLSEGSAKVRFSKKVTRVDAKRAIRILKYCLMQVGFDYETGKIDIDRISTGIPASQRSRIVQVREIINELESTFGKTIPLDDITRSASEKNIDENEVEEIIERLKRSGDIFEPKRGFISKL
jgi:replicative DNA helicase Mcm